MDLKVKNAKHKKGATAYGGDAKSPAEGQGFFALTT